MTFQDDSRFSSSGEGSFDWTPSPDTTECTQERQRDLEVIDSFVQECLNEPTDSHHIFPLIRKFLWQRKLNGFLDEKEILNEAYCRAIKAVKSGKKLVNIPAWFKTTCLYIISEAKKDEIKVKNCSMKLKNTEGFDEASEGNIDFEYSLIQKNVDSLIFVLETLSKEERSLLILWKVKGYSWSEIGVHLGKHKAGLVDDKKMQANLRKQGQRILEKLRKTIASLNRL
jgi:DNA-directed RNA polymerase specialized sigma24 family protein